MRDRKEFLPQSPNILNVNIIGAVREKYGIQYCPICLEQGGAFKKIWRLALMPICLDHRVLLVDRCKHCKAPIYLTKTTSFLKDLRSCTFCWRSLNTQPKVISVEEWEFFESINSAIHSGWCSYRGLEMYSPLFFKGLWRILYSFYGTKGREKRTWDRVCEFYDSPSEPLKKTRVYNSFKDETPEKRLFILGIVQKMLSDWPRSFINACEFSGITMLVLDLSKSGLPYWIQVVAETDLNKNWYKISLEEFTNALSFLVSKKIPISKTELNKTLGVDRSRKFNKQEYKVFKDYLNSNPDSLHY